MSLLLLIIGLILFIGLVVVHEFGHFIMARRGGVEVEEFGIFFPPRLYKHKTKAGWLFTINLLPLGGFVRLKGEHDSDTEPGTFGAASLATKSKIMAAGVVMNLVTALVMFTVIALVGMPQLLDKQFNVKKDSQLVSSSLMVGYVDPGSPAAKAGLRSTDEITDIARPGYSPVAISSKDQLPNITKRFAGQTVDVFYVRDGQHQVVKTTLLSAKVVEASQKTDNPKGYLGIIPNQFQVRRATWSAPVVAVGLSAQLTAATFQGLGHALGGLGSTIAGVVTGNHTARQNGQTSAASQVTGPVGIFETLKGGSAMGARYVLFIIAYISLVLAIMNVLPFPALDGGRLWFTLLSRALKRPLSAKAEEAINTAGILVLLSLMILITVADVHRFF